MGIRATRTRTLWGWALWVSAPLAVPVFALGACSEAPKLVGEGSACALTTDCDRGLVCVPQRNGTRVCTGDLTSIATATKPPVDAGPRDADGGEGGEGGGGEGGTNEGGAIAPVDAAGE